MVNPWCSLPIPALGAAINWRETTCWKPALERAMRAGAHLLHVDVSDGLLLPYIMNNWATACCALEALTGLSPIPVDVHLIAIDTIPKIHRLDQIGVQSVTVHAEAPGGCESIMNKDRPEDMGIGVAIWPDTSILSLQGVLSLVDSVLVMMVGPGEDYPCVVERNLNKIKLLRGELRFEGRVGIDGHVDGALKKIFSEVGVDTFIAGRHLEAIGTNEVRQTRPIGVEGDDGSG